MQSYTHVHRVRYRECDPMGVTYHTHYLDHFEAARTEMLRHVGITYREIEESGIIMPVTDVSIKYHKPGRYDDLLHIHTHMAEYSGGVRVEISYEVENADTGDLLVTGKTTLCFVDRKTGRPTRAPKAFKDSLARLQEAV